MSTSRFLVGGAVGLVAAAVMLAGAGALDQPALRFGALAAILGVLVYKEAWTWWGDLRSLALCVGLIAAAILVAAAIESVV